MAASSRRTTARASDVVERMRRVAAAERPPALGPEEDDEPNTTGAEAPAAPAAEPAAASSSADADGVPLPERTAGATRRPVKTHVRFTVDLPKAQHRALRLLTVEMDADAGRIVRALLSELEGDPRLAERVRHRLDED